MQYWQTVVEYPTGNKTMDEFALIMDNIPKIVFSHTLKSADPIVNVWESSKLSTRTLAVGV